ncbi:unnamed protein product, partial [Meganyctiphanes norvegica]
CDGGNDALYEHGETWIDGCWSKHCQGGSIKTIVLKECCEVGEDVYNPDSGWDDECWNYRCTQGIIKRALKPNMCCAVGDKVYRNGEFWYPGMMLYQCDHGISKLINQNDGGLSLQINLPSAAIMSSNSLLESTRYRRDISDDASVAQ